MFLNKTEKLLFFFFVFLNLIPLDKAQAFRRINSNSKVNDYQFNRDSKILNESISFVDKSIKRLKNNHQNFLFSNNELEINYSDNLKNRNIQNQEENTQDYLELIEGNDLESIDTILSSISAVSKL